MTNKMSLFKKNFIYKYMKGRNTVNTWGSRRGQQSVQVGHNETEVAQYALSTNLSTNLVGKLTK
jgi:hypothetical protein